ncbi:MAG: hypothetical protein AAFN77_21620 [Planctomycetota bacterium]
MNVVIIHYHLNRGGVTQVVRNHLSSLDSVWGARQSNLPVTLLHGGRTTGWGTTTSTDFHNLNVEMDAVEELDYDDLRPHKVPLYSSLSRELENRGLKPADTVLHFHNHALGKNLELPDAVCRLAKNGFACLLQIHDFVEDFRPEQYRSLLSDRKPNRDATVIEQVSGLLYPQAEQIQYAVLNGRDQDILIQAGLDPTRLHLLPNSIRDLQTRTDKQQIRREMATLGIPRDKPLFVYPVRGIRRKNLGEALLWSALAETSTTFAMTLAPMNPNEQPTYQRWVSVAERLQLNWRFNFSEAGYSLAEVIAASDRILTTSVCEGFGLTFLEAWLAGRPVVGRDLPEITTDFVAAGIRFPELSAKLKIPIDYVGRQHFCQSFATAYQRFFESFGPALGAVKTDDLMRAANEQIIDDLVDFALLNSQQQLSVIENVVSNELHRAKLLELNPTVAVALQCSEPDANLIQNNSTAIRKQFSMQRIGEQLLDIYHRLLRSDNDTSLKTLTFGHRVVDRFVSPCRFHPLRVEL